MLKARVSEGSESAGAAFEKTLFAPTALEGAEVEASEIAGPAFEVSAPED